MGTSNHLLLIEDNPGDVRLIKETFEETPYTDSLHVVTKGEEALDFLKQRGDYADVSRPSVVLLDWNLPDVPSAEVLTTITEDPDLKATPVIAFSGSASPQSVAEAYERQANAFIEKPAEIEELAEIIQTLGKFWFDAAHLPVSEPFEDGSVC